MTKSRSSQAFFQPTRLPNYGGGEITSGPKKKHRNQTPQIIMISKVLLDFPLFCFIGLFLVVMFFFGCGFFFFGDFASCAQADGSCVPPRAQAAHQMATIAFKNIVTLIQGGSRLKPFVYHDHGSLVSLSGFSTVGSLMGNLTKGSMMVEGRIARMVYISLYRMHQVALHGYVKTGLMMLVGSLNRVLRPTLKLH